MSPWPNCMLLYTEPPDRTETPHPLYSCIPKRLLIKDEGFGVLVFFGVFRVRFSPDFAEIKNLIWIYNPREGFRSASTTSWNETADDLWSLPFSGGRPDGRFLRGRMEEDVFGPVRPPAGTYPAKAAPGTSARQLSG
jgi:hypothetical protein